MYHFSALFRCACYSLGFRHDIEEPGKADLYSISAKVLHTEYPVIIVPDTMKEAPGELLTSKIETAFKEGRAAWESEIYGNP